MPTTWYLINTLNWLFWRCSCFFLNCVCKSSSKSLLLTLFTALIKAHIDTTTQVLLFYIAQIWAQESPTLYTLHHRPWTTQVAGRYLRILYLRGIVTQKFGGLLTNVAASQFAIRVTNLTYYTLCQIAREYVIRKTGTATIISTNRGKWDVNFSETKNLNMTRDNVTIIRSLCTVHNCGIAFSFFATGSLILVMPPISCFMMEAWFLPKVLWIINKFFWINLCYVHTDPIV